MLLSSATTLTKTPRVQAIINGISVDTVIHADVTNGGSFKSSHFELTVWVNSGGSDNQWLSLIAGRITVTISIYSQWDDSEITIVEGLADSIDFDPVKMIARIRGRDYSSVLISSAFQDSFSNQTASEIANYIAARHGFDASVTQTTTMVGSYRGSSYNQMSLNAYSHVTNEWDLLIHLAKTEGFEMFVDGTSLVFAPQTALLRNYRNIDKGNVKEIKFHKACTLSDQTNIVVKSWNSWTNSSSNSTTQQTPDGSAADVTGLNADPGTSLVFIRPNLVPQAADNLAQLYLEALNEQNLGIEVVMPGEASLQPRDILMVSGIGASFDTEYTVRSVHRRFSSTAGYLLYARGFVTGPTTPISSATAGQ